MINSLDYDFDLHTRFWNKIETGNSDALSSLMLCLLPNLQKIDMLHYGDWMKGHPCVVAILKRAARLKEASSDSPFALNKLRQVRPHNMDHYSFPKHGFSVSGVASVRNE